MLHELVDKSEFPPGEAFPRIPFHRRLATIELVAVSSVQVNEMRCSLGQ